MSKFLLFRNYTNLSLLLFVIFIVNIFLILNNPTQSFAFIISNSSNESGTLADEKQEDLAKKKFTVGSPIILNGFNNPSILSSTEEKKIESITDQTYISPEIPITNYTVILPDPDKEIALVKNKTVSDFEKTKDIFSNISKTSAKSSSDIIKSKDIFKFTPSELKKNRISFAAEPSIATNGKIFLFTGNHFAAISKDGANNWKYFNLTEVMSDFCCDQDVVYDPKHKLFVWYLQGATSCSNNENRSLLGISRDGSTWRFIEIKPTDLNKDLKNLWFDYPTLALSENFAYLTTNVVKGFQCLNFINKPLKDFSVIIRIPLDELSNSIINTSNSLHFDSYYQKGTNNRFTFTPVQGATNTMYWATHLGNTNIRIYNWTESFDSNSVKYKDVTIDFPWVPIKKGSLSCPIENKTSGSWCNKADSRIKGGWISDKIIGFLWNAAAGKETGTILPLLGHILMERCLIQQMI